MNFSRCIKRTQKQRLCLCIPAFKCRVVPGCQQGFYTTGGAEGVGRSTTAAVVLASIAILAADFLLTKLLF